jgi:hypothetical protein
MAIPNMVGKWKKDEKVGSNFLIHNFRCLQQQPNISQSLCQTESHAYLILISFQTQAIKLEFGILHITLRINLNTIT